MGIVEFLYDQTAFQCSNCGLRFPRNDPLEYQKHKDWHFQENVKKQNKSQYQCRRNLYPTNWITEDDPWKVDESNDDQCHDSKQEIPTVYKSSNLRDHYCVIKILMTNLTNRVRISEMRKSLRSRKHSMT